MVPEVVSCLDQNAPFPVAAARLFSAGTASTHLESCNGLPTAERLYRSLRYSLTGPRNGSPAWCIIAAVAAPAAVIRMLAPRRGVVPTSVAPLLAGRRFLRLLGSRDRLRGQPCRRCRSQRGRCGSCGSFYRI